MRMTMNPWKLELRERSCSQNRPRFRGMWELRVVEGVEVEVGEVLRLWGVRMEVAVSRSIEN